MRLRRRKEPSRWCESMAKVAVVSFFLLSTFVGMLQISSMMKLSLLRSPSSASDYHFITEKSGLPQRKLRSKEGQVPSTVSKSKASKEEYLVEGENNVKSKQIAYVISITSCQTNSTNVLDGAAILGHSIHLVSQSSIFGYARYAFVYEPEAVECVPTLQRLGWTTIVEDKLPVEKDQIINAELRENVDKNGCCGIKEFMKLKVYTLEDHPIAVHLDTDALLLQPMDVLYNTMLAPTTTDNTTLTDDHLMFHKRPTNASDFYFTRDYHQGSTRSDDPSQFGVQGGFLAVKPNRTMYQELITRLMEQETYGRFSGWSGLGHTGFWGSSQIQGYLSYVYKHHYPGRAVELNRCIYNAMINDSPYHKRTGACLTKERKCQDCRTIEFEKIMSIHLTTCRKPWECPYLREEQHPKLCRDAHRAWFQVRRDLENNVWKRPVPVDGWRYQWTLGYCQRPVGMARLLGQMNVTMGPDKPKNRRQYVPLILPPIHE